LTTVGTGSSLELLFDWKNENNLENKAFTENGKENKKFKCPWKLH
jgi:hypothetical protein